MYVKRLMSDKLGTRSDRYNFVGYPKESKGYIFYQPDEQKLFVSLRTTFLKKEFLGEGTVASDVEFGEIQQVEEPKHLTDTREPALIRSNPESVPLRRSGRVPHQPDRYYGFLVRDGDPIELDENNEDPISYMDAIQRPDSDRWLGAMKSEMESMEINNIWTLVDLLEGIKPIRLETYFDNEIWQMDVQTTFLHRKLDEEVYMIQPEEFTSLDESKVCRLLRSIYGLKHASQSWYLCFDRCIKSYDFVMNEEEQCIHKWVIDSVIIFLVLFIDDVLLIENEITTL